MENKDQPLPDDGLYKRDMTIDEIMEEYPDMDREKLEFMMKQANKPIPAGDGIFPQIQQNEIRHWRQISEETLEAIKEAMTIHYLMDTNSVHPRFIQCGCFTVLPGVHTKRQAFLIRKGYYFRKYGRVLIEWKTTGSGHIVFNRPIIF